MVVLLEGSKTTSNTIRSLGYYHQKNITHEGRKVGVFENAGKTIYYDPKNNVVVRILGGDTASYNNLNITHKKDRKKNSHKDDT